MSKDQTVLFHSTVFGPVRSRRLGVSLGINLMPDNGKICSFDCLYCEAGFNAQGAGDGRLPDPERLRTDLRERLAAMRAAGDPLDVITFSGNGEPTLHPAFPEIVDIVIALRDEFYPSAKVSVLSNSTRIFDPAVAGALRKVDNNILKLDSAIEPTMRMIDRPNSPEFTTARLIDALAGFGQQCIIQTMMLRGEFEGRRIDNTTPAEVEALIAACKRIRPREVMLYSIDRSTPAERLERVDAAELRAIGARMEAEGIKVQVNA